MFARKGWFSGWGSKVRNPHSLEHLKYLYNVMSKNQNVSEQNKTLLVETLRMVAEILIWGDQNDSTVFDFFLEKNMLSFFLKIMKQKCGSYVCVQLLQTLNILFENIRNETSLYYLLSNNHVNSIIVHKFDFSDEEVMAYYISFLKTLSLKLNAHTIHFFFNEHTNDFPLYTEAIKFFNHSEKMVRIAVRTLTLNVFRVDEKSMLKFVGDRTAVPYFSNLVWFIGNHVLEIDTCLRKQITDHQMLIKLDDLVAEHLDHLHYINDILLLRINDLNEILTEHLLNRLLIPLYIYSLIPPSPEELALTSPNPRPRISRIVSLFLVSQVFLIIAYDSLVQKLVNIILNGNMTIFEKPEFAAPPETLEESMFKVNRHSASNSVVSEEEEVSMNDPKNSVDEPTPEAEETEEEEEEPKDSEAVTEYNEASITDEEKAAAANSSNSTKRSTPKNMFDGERPFLEALFDSLDCINKLDDHTFIFSLCLVYAMVHNEGVNDEQLGDLVVKTETSDTLFTNELNSSKLIDHLVEIMHLSCQYNSRIRLVTLEMSILLLKKLVMRDTKSILSDHHLASIEQAKEESTLILRNFYKSEEEALFLDMFEEEFQEMQKKKLNVEYLMMDAKLLLPPNQLTPLLLSNVEFTRRLPCADVERTRYAIRVFFLLRHLSLTLRNEGETQLPLTNHEAFVKVEQLLDLNNSDLIACTVIMKDPAKQRRFMVIDMHQLILIEPDVRKLGWGVARFVALLQDVEVNPDKDDSRSLHITIRQSSGNATPKRLVMNAKFVFDDHIRCMAAKQRLTKGRTKARQRKMHQIAKLIELSALLETHSSSHSSHRRPASNTNSNREFPRSISQTEGFRKHLHVAHKPLCRAVPGHAVVDTRTSSNPRKASSRRRSISSVASSPSVASGHSRDASPRPVASTSGIALDMSEEMIPLEDLSPKSDRRRNRSKSENRQSDRTVKIRDKCERV